jgi:biopolymer transport protein ExbD
MAMAVGGSKDHVADINMTPMIDVLLVLLVIFMIAQPMLQKSIDVQIPEEKEPTQANPAPNIVLEIFADGTLAINTEPVAKDKLQERLTAIYAGRPDKAMMVKADPEVLYDDVIQAMDAARGAGVQVIGAMLVGT